jgi:hypothetical protein
MKDFQGNDYRDPFYAAIKNYSEKYLAFLKNISGISNELPITTEYTKLEVTQEVIAGSAVSMPVLPELDELTTKPGLKKKGQMYHTIPLNLTDLMVD